MKTFVKLVSPHAILIRDVEAADRGQWLDQGHLNSGWRTVCFVTVLQLQYLKDVIQHTSQDFTAPVNLFFNHLKMLIDVC